MHKSDTPEQATPKNKTGCSPIFFERERKGHCIQKAGIASDPRIRKVRIEFSNDFI
jgi:hypothetical protein